MKRGWLVAGLLWVVCISIGTTLLWAHDTRPGDPNRAPLRCAVSLEKAAVELARLAEVLDSAVARVAA